MARRVLISCIHLQRRYDDFRAEFERHGFVCDLPEVAQQLEESWLVENVGQYDGVIAGDDPFPRRVIEAGVAGRLRALVKWGIGVDAIDQKATSELGVRFSNTPGVFGDEVADVAMGYVILLARGLHEIDHRVREGVWHKPVGTTLRGKTLGVVGLGSIGRAIAARASAFGMRVVGSDEAPIAEWPAQWPQIDLDETLVRSDFVVLACALTEANRHMIDERALGRMKPGSYLVNVARGPLVDENALVPRLSDGSLAGAALDVFEQEPLPMASPLRTLPNCLFGSHNGSNTAEAVDRVNRLAVDLLFDFLGVEAG